LGGLTPKGFIRLGGKALFLYSLEVLLSHEAVADAVLVVPEGFEPKAKKIITGSRFSKKVAIVVGGNERWQSVENGVRAAAVEWVLVHDAARPFVTKAVVDAVLVKKHNYDGAITVTPEVDTIRATSGDLAGEIVDRQSLVRVGTPQLFRRRVLLEAFAAARDCPSPPTDEAVLMQRMGVPVAFAWGDPLNFKITTAADLAMAEALIAHHGKK
jgi:2-C-methyl-D-erythritol 4-phosphate cytidylyltransferase